MNLLKIRSATIEDCPLIYDFIYALAVYEKLEHEVVADASLLADTLFGDRPAAEVVIAEWDGQAAGFALFFNNYSTFLARPGIYLEDLFVHEEFRGKGIGKALLAYLARKVLDGNGGRFEWSVLDWNEPSIRFYENLGARGMGEWVQFRLDGQALEALAAKADQP